MNLDKMKKYAKSHYALLPIYTKQDEYHMLKQPEIGDIFYKHRFFTNSEYNNFCRVIKVTKKSIIFRHLKPEIVAKCNNNGDIFDGCIMYKLDSEQLVTGKNNRLPIQTINSIWLPRQFLIISRA
jgi:hypothetical protein